MDWKKIEFRLMDLGHPVNFRLNGHLISIYRHIKGNKIYLLVFIDRRGVIPGEEHQLKEPWYKLVLNKKSSFVYSKKTRYEFIKKLGKSAAEELGLNQKTVFYKPSFSSFRTLKAQYSKIEGLEYVQE